MTALFSVLLVLQFDPFTVQLDAENLLQAGRWKEARTLLERAFRETGDPYFLKMLTEAGFDARDYRYVLRVVQEAEARGDSIPREAWDRALRAAFLLNRRAWIREHEPRILEMNDPDLIRLLADIHQNWDDYATAVRLYREALKYGKDPDILNYLGYALLQVGQPDSAAAVFEDLRESDTLRAAKGLALVRERQGDLDGAIQALEEAHRVSPGDPEVLYRLAVLYLRKGKLQQAYPLLEALVNFDPFAYPYRLLLARTYFQDRRYRRALEHLAVLRTVHPRRAEVRDLLARTYWNLRQPARAIAEAREAVRLARTPEKRRTYRTFLVFLYLANQKPREAIRVLSRIHPPFLSDTEMIFLAEAYIQVGKPRKARDLLVQAVRFRNDTAFLASAAEQLYAIRALREAEIALRRLLALDSTNARGRFLLALIATDRQDVPTARRMYESLLQDTTLSDSDRATYANNLGYLLLTTGGDLEEARQYIELALKLQPDVPAYLDSMGWYYFLVGDLGQAKAYLDRAYINGGKDDPEILEHLGDLYRRLGDLRKARRYYQEALRVASPDGSKRLREKLEDLATGDGG